MNPSANRNHAKRTGTVVLFALYGTALLLNAAAWFSPAFADAWARGLFPVWNNTLGRLTSLFSWSVGERLIVIGLLWLGFLIVSITGSLLIICRVIRSESNPFRPFFRATLWLVAFISLIQTTNCFIVYHCTPLESVLFAGTADRTYTVAELTNLRDTLVERCNAMAETLPREDNGEIRVPAAPELATQARHAMQQLSVRISQIADGSASGQDGIRVLATRLSGYYVRPKGLTASGFMCQQNMMGYYFPFSMEANYNTLMTDMNKPYTICHELSHTHGFIYEDEANLLGFMGCMASEDPVFVYSGYLGVLNYVDNDFYRQVGREVYETHPAISSLVRFDDTFVREEVRAAVEETALLPTELVRAGADTFVDTTLKVNGITDGKASYSRVVGLLLRLMETYGLEMETLS